MKLTFFTVVLSLFSATAFCQNVSAPDSFVTNSGIVHHGEMVDNRFPDYFMFRTTEDYRLKVPYSTVKSYHFKSNGSAGANGEMRNPSYSPQRYISRRATGIGLTCAGSSVLITGIALIVTNPGGVQPYSNTNSAGVNFKGAAAGGFVMCLLSPALFISGAVLWAKANRAIKHIRVSRSPKDL